MSHSIIAPSAAGIWGKPDGCTGYPVMAATYPELEESEESKEGTATHEVGAALIEHSLKGRAGWPRREGVVDTPATNGFIVSDEMYDGALMYYEDVRAHIVERGVFGGDNLGVEVRVLADQIHELSYGTPDCYLFDPKRGELIVWDFKFGYEVVEAFENWQGINYVAGIMRKLGLEDRDEYIRVRIRIVQPRAHHRDGPIREWSVMASDLRAHINTLSNNANESLGPNAQTRSGSHCKHCPARHACEAALRGGMRLYEAAAKPVPVELSNEALAVQYGIVQRARKQLEYLESGYEEQIKGLMRSGAQVPGYIAEEGTGRERWARPVEEVIALGEYLGFALRKDAAVTPNQARKLGIDGSVITAYSETPRTGIKIVPDTGNKAKQVFAK